MRTIFLLLSLVFFSWGCDWKTECVGPDCPCTGSDCPCIGPDCPPPGECPQPPVCPPPPGCPAPSNCIPDDLISDTDCDGIPDWEEERFGTDPQNPDTDGDGILDGIEVGYYSSPDPRCKGIFPENLRPPTRTTSPVRQDSDCDGIADGDEDKNKNGQTEPDETDPNNVDTDGDGLWDGVEVGVRQGMLLLHGHMVAFGDTVTLPNGRVVRAEVDPLCKGRRHQYAAAEADCPPEFRRLTNPLKADSDEDGIPDGTEDSNKNGCYEPNLFEKEDAEPKKGPFFTGEGSLGETDANDKNSPDPNTGREVLDACLPGKLVPVDIERNMAVQIALGLPMGFANSYRNIVRTLGSVTTQGLMGFDATRNVAFVAWKQSGDAIHDWNALRNVAVEHANKIVNGNAGSVPIPFSSWNASAAHVGYNAVSITFQVRDVSSPIERANAIAALLLGAGNDGLTVPAHVERENPQYIRAQYVLHIDEAGHREVVVVMAVARDDNAVSKNDGSFGLNDVAGGAALARYLDRTVVQCERAVAVRRKVDFLFVVDDSGSMAGSQGQLGAAADGMAKALEDSTLDWRVALVTNSYHTGGPNVGIVRGFTKDTQVFRSWLQGNVACPHFTRACRSNWMAGLGGPACGSSNSCWIGTSGDASESMLGAARLALMDMHHPSPNNPVLFEKDADIVVIILSDTDDQNRGLYASGGAEEIQNFVDFFQGRTTTNSVPGMAANVPGYVAPGAPVAPGLHCPASGTGCLAPVRPGETILVHSISCPYEEYCGDMIPNTNPTRVQRIANVTGGTFTDISAETVIRDSMAEIVRNIIGRTGLKTRKPFIGASLRVAMDNPEQPSCDKTNVPRSRQNGFDYDGISQTVSLFGNCRPPVGQKSNVALSYLAWEASDRLPCENDPRFINDVDENYCRGPFICDFDTDTCVCSTTPMCGEVCPPGTSCNMELCKCIGVIG